MLILVPILVDGGYLTLSAVTSQLMGKLSYNGGILVCRIRGCMRLGNGIVQDS